MHKYVIGLLLFFLLQACRPVQPVPKPRGYFKIELPEKQYATFEKTGFPYQFEYPVYGKVAQDSQLVAEEASPYWINIEFKELGAAIYLSYKPISAKQPFYKLVEESYKLSYAHDVRADYIKTPEFRTAHDLVGVFYHVGGNAASSYQFFITDTLKHFIRGSLYFNTTPNADSLKPAAEFLKKDMEHLVETLQFK